MLTFEPIKSTVFGFLKKQLIIQQLKSDSINSKMSSSGSKTSSSSTAVAPYLLNYI